jgi:phosphonate transport system substrate-binding protein
MKDFTTTYSIAIIGLSLLLYSFLLYDDKEQNTVYTFAVYPQYRSQQLYQTWQPILKRLSEETGLKFKLTGNPSAINFEGALYNGSYDFAYVNPYHAAKAGRNKNYKAILNDPNEEIQGVLVVKKGKIKTISQLENQKIAFPSPNTLAASIILRQELSNQLNARLKPIYLATPSDVYMQIHNEDILGGGGTKRTFDQLRPSLKANLIILHTTKSVPAHPIVAHSKVSKLVKDKVIRAFLKMSKNPKDQILLSKVYLENVNIVQQKVYDKLLGSGDF